MFRFFVVSVIAVSLVGTVGCRSTTPVVKKELQAERSVNKELKTNVSVKKSFNEVWSRSIEFLSMNNIYIKNADKNTGLISAESTILDSSHIDCEEVRWKKLVSNVSRVNVYIKSDGDVTSARFSMNGSAQWSNTNGFGATMGVPMEQSCTTTGRLEREYFEHIAN